LTLGGIATLIASRILATKQRVVEGSAEGGPTREDDPKQPPVPAPKPEPQPKPSAKGKPKPIAVGKRGDPTIEALLAEMGVMFRDAGINTQQISPAEVTVMPKTPGPAYAIPPRHLWSRMVQTLVTVVQPMRTELGFPMSYRGYRPPDYNKAVEGARNSRHIYFEGVDVRPAGAANTSANRRLLALTAARMYLTLPKALKMGFGAYGAPTPSNIHVDTGFSHRDWREADHYIAQVADVA
jgi:hypothetical protein